jgi:hypothetical protein
MTGTNRVGNLPKKYMQSLFFYLLLRCCESAHFLLVFSGAARRGTRSRISLIFGIERVLLQNLEICAQVSGETGLRCLYMFVSFAPTKRNHFNNRNLPVIWSINSILAGPIAAHVSVPGATSVRPWKFQ